MALQRVACTCHAWGHLLRRGPSTPAAAIWGAAWLTVPMFGEDELGRPCVTLTAADALRRAPPGERVRLRAGTTITEEVNVLQPLQLLAEENVTMKGKLVLQGGSFAPGLRHGVVQGLRLRHFMEEAPLAPRPSPLAPRPSPLAPRPSPLAPRPSPLAPRPSPVGPEPPITLALALTTPPHPCPSPPPPAP